MENDGFMSEPWPKVSRIVMFMSQPAFPVSSVAVERHGH